MKKNIIITGASSGFGKETAKLFAKDGHNLLLLSRNIDKLKALDIEGADYQSLDVSDAVAFNEIVSAWADKVGSIDLIVNNAGVMMLGQIGSQDKSEFTQMIKTNIDGVINGMQATVNIMKKQKSGTIVNISSIAGIKSFPDHAVYSGTKAAVNAITETVREELAPYGIRVCNILPGAFSTNLLYSTSDKKIIDGYEEWKKTMGEMPGPIEVAKTIKFIFDAPQSLNFREIVIHATKQVG